MSASDHVFAQLAGQNRALAALDSAARARIGPMLDVQFTNVRAYLAVVFGNNPALTPLQVLARDDVQAVMNKAVAQAVSHVETQIAVAASAGHQLGVGAAQAQLKVMGYDLASEPDQGSVDYLGKITERLSVAASQLKGDIETLVQDGVLAVPMPVTYHEDPENGVVNVSMAKAVADGHAAVEALDAALRNFSYRGQLAVSAAAQRSYADAASATYGLAESEFDLQIGKMWVANFADGHIPCPVCAALSGQVVAWDDVFVVPAGVAYTPFGELHGPQAHPNCQCKLVPVPMEPDTVPEADSAEPADDAEDDELVDAATVAPEDAALPQYVTADEVRALPSKTFVQLLTGLLLSLIGMLRKRRRRNG